jgi:CRP-like cAMP-binding protein
MPNERSTSTALRLAPRNSPTPRRVADGRLAIGDPRRQNRFLGALTAADYAWLEPHLEPVALPVKMVLAARNEPVAFVYFPAIGVVSMINRTATSACVEVGTIGAEGLSGVQAMLSDVALPSETVIQVPGHGFRVPAAIVATGARKRPSFRRLIDRYTQALLVQVSQTATCNLLHPIDERCARWLLTTHDRMGGGDTFDLTHEFLACMLGVRRAGVTVAAGRLARARIIRYTRGRVTILDRPGLEAASCECYGLVRDQFDRLVGGAPPR